MVNEIMSWRTLTVAFVPYLFGIAAFIIGGSINLIAFSVFCTSLATMIYLIDSIWKRAFDVEYQWTVWIVLVSVVASMTQAMVTTIILAAIFSFF
jgi:hypothetical protein